MSSNNSGAILFLIRNSLWQLPGQYFIAVGVSSMKKEKVYMHTC